MVSVRVGWCPGVPIPSKPMLPPGTANPARRARHPPGPPAGGARPVKRWASPVGAGCRALRGLLQFPYDASHPARLHFHSSGCLSGPFPDPENPLCTTLCQLCLAAAGHGDFDCCGTRCALHVASRGEAADEGGSRTSGHGHPRCRADTASSSPLHSAPSTVRCPRAACPRSGDQDGVGCVLVPGLGPDSSSAPNNHGHLTV